MFIFRKLEMYIKLKKNMILSLRQLFLKLLDINEKVQIIEMLLHLFIAITLYQWKNVNNNCLSSLCQLREFSFSRSV